MRKTLLLLLLSQVAFGQAPTRYIIRAGKLFDSENKRFKTSQEILVEGDRIKKVGNLTKKDRANAEVVDLSRSTVIPGLIDSHSHLLLSQVSGVPMERDILAISEEERIRRAGQYAKEYLDAGITTVKDLGNSGQYLDLILRKQAESGTTASPRIWASGPILSPPNGQFGKLPEAHKALPEKEYTIVKTPEDAVAAVTEHHKRGVDVIKVCVTNDNGLILSPEILQAIVKTAHAKGLKVTAHAPFDDVVRDAIDAGVDGIEHGYGIGDSTLQRMAQKKVYLVPTDGTFEGYKGILSLGEWKAADSDVNDFVKKAKDRLLRAVKAGVPIVYGSDAYLKSPEHRGAAAKDALISYFVAGLTVGDVLQIGTYNGAVAAGKAGELGVIKPGARADIVAFEGDLETNFRPVISRDASFAMRDGRVFRK